MACKPPKLQLRPASAACAARLHKLQQQSSSAPTPHSLERLSASSFAAASAEPLPAGAMPASFCALSCTCAAEGESRESGVAGLAGRGRAAAYSAHSSIARAVPCLQAHKA